ncbi:MAG: ExbD/TolR family protein [Bdellovibrionia bacterium]
MAASGFDPENSEGINDINITPFVDVVLVLLVIFMVTAPMMMKDIIGIELPKVAKAEASNSSLIAIAITSQGQVLLNGELTSEEALSEFITQTIKNNPDSQAIISADGNSKHFDFIRIIDVVKSAGLDKFAIQVEKVKEAQQ